MPENIMTCSKCDAPIASLSSRAVNIGLSVYSYATDGETRQVAVRICKDCVTGVLTLKVALKRTTGTEEFVFDAFLPDSPH